LLLSTALAACTVGPDYTPPKAELAPFHNLVDASTPQAHSARPLDHWRDRQSRGLLWPRCPAKPRSVLQASSAAFGNEPFNDDCGGLNDLSIWAFSGIRVYCPSHSANKVTWLSVDAHSSILASYCSDSDIVPTCDAFVPWMGVAASETRAALANGDHYREMAGRLRGLARLTHSPGMRRELVDLARRYDRRGEHFDGRPR
jgi:hypothetical protein